MLVSCVDTSNKHLRISSKFKLIIGGNCYFEQSDLSSSSTSLSESILFFDKEFSGIFNIAKESMNIVVD